MKYVLILFLGCTILLATGCSQESQDQEVIIYTSVDQVYSSKILKQFTKKTGIIVKAVYDVEASKAVGLEQRLIAEQKRAKADLFWNSEFMRTARLARINIFAQYALETERYSSTNYFSQEKLWYGMGARSRVLIVNTQKISPEEYPTSLQDLVHPKWKGKVAIANPFFGSTSTHFTALLRKWKEKRFVQFLKGLQSNNVALLAGNSVVKDAVGNGKYVFGLVDTDDALVGIEQGLPIKIIYYDQEDQGVFSIFQTVSLVKNGPNPSAGKQLVEYLLSEQVENKLISMNAVQLPLLSPPSSEQKMTMWTVDPDHIVESLRPSIDLMRMYLE